jgi:tRNA(fMet)-specific endonuclease VapC
LNDQPAAIRAVTDLEEDGLGFSIISYCELYEGAYYGRDPAAAIAGLRTFLQGKRLLPVTRVIAERFGVVRGSFTRHVRNQIGDMDLLTAATALELGLTLLTRNERHFGLIPGITIYRTPPEEPAEPR